MAKYYRTASELPADCLYELKDRMFYGLDGKDALIDLFQCASEIPDEVVFQRYKGKEFSPEDFWDDGGSWDDFSIDLTAYSVTSVDGWLSVFAN